MSEKEMKEWLNSAFYAQKKLKALDELIKQTRERARGLSRSNRNIKGKSDTHINGVENTLMKLADMEYKYNMQKHELTKVSEDISKAIANLHDDDLETVLINRYLLFHTIEQTAEIMNYSTETIRKKTNKAVERLCNIE